MKRIVLSILVITILMTHGYDVQALSIDTARFTDGVVFIAGGVGLLFLQNIIVDGIIDKYNFL